MTAISGGGKGRMTPVATTCMSRRWKVEMCKPKNVTRRDDQSAISSNKSSTKQHKLICQVSTNTRPLVLDGQTTAATESGTIATTKHTILRPTYHHLQVAQLNNRRNLYNTTLDASGTLPLTMLLCGSSWRSNQNHFYLLLV